VGYSADGFEVSDIVCWLRYICSVLNQEAGILNSKSPRSIRPVDQSQTTMHLGCRHLAPGLGGVYPGLVGGLWCV